VRRPANPVPSRPESAARLLVVAVNTRRGTRPPSAEYVRSSLARAAQAGGLRSLIARLPLLWRAALLWTRGPPSLPGDYDWWFKFGYHLARLDPAAAAGVLRAVGRDSPVEALTMGVLAALSSRRVRRTGRTPRGRAADPVERAVRLATASLSEVHPAILQELRSALRREYGGADRPVNESEALNRVGWPVGIVLSVLESAYDSAESGEAPPRYLRDVALSVLRNWPSFAWTLTGRLTAGGLGVSCRLATLDAMIAAGLWAEAAGVIRVDDELMSERVSREAVRLGLPLAAAGVLSTLALSSKNPMERWRLLMSAGRLAAEGGRRALAGLLFREAAWTLRPHADSGAPVLAQYHEALERAALALADAGLKIQAFRLWSELKLSAEGIRESGIVLPGDAEREARATLWMAELVSEVSHREAALWYLKASSLFNRLDLKALAEYSRKRAALELAFDGEIASASNLAGAGPVS